MNVYRKLLLISILVFGPMFVFADIEITEIMYNPEGSDDGYEYVKIKNTSGQTIDTSEYYFLENNTYHGLYPENSELLNAGDIALMVKDIPTASARYGSHNYIKSSFSLNNTGETLSLADPNKEILHTITYNSESGGNGDGTAYVVGGSSSSTSSSSSNSNSTSSSDSTSTSNTSTYVVYEPHFIPYINIPNTVLSQSLFTLDAGAFYKNEKGKEYKEKRGYFYINFGDGYSEMFRESVDMEYSYRNPGTYIIVLEFYNSKLAMDNGNEPDAFFEKTITVVNNDISIETVDYISGLTLKNKTNQKIDLADWNIVFRDYEYKFPKYTFLQSQSSLNIPLENLGLPYGISNFEGLLLLNEKYIHVDSFSNTKKSYTTTSQTSTSKKQAGMESGKQTNNISLGDNVILEDNFNFGLESFPETISFQENNISDIGNDSKSPKQSKLYLWIMGGVIILLSVLKSLFKHKNPKPESYVISEEGKFDIEHIE